MFSHATGRALELDIILALSQCSSHLYIWRATAPSRHVGGTVGIHNSGGASMPEGAVGQASHNDSWPVLEQLNMCI